jgi:ParB-like nuclease domain
MKKKPKANSASDKKQEHKKKKARDDTQGHGAKKHKAKKPSKRKSAPKDPSPSYEVYFIPVDEIKVAGKRRQVNPEKVNDLKESVAKLGLRTPLTIRNVRGKRYLITGLHRWEAVKALGWEKVPCVYIRGGKKLARLWEISENLHRAELTRLEEYELINEWLQLTGAAKSVSAQNGEKPKGGRPKSGMSEAARNLPGKGTESAKRHKIERAAKIAKMDPVVRQEIAEAGLADSPTKIDAIASEPGKEAQLKKLHHLKAGRRKPHEDAPLDSASDDELPFEVMKREWKPSKKWTHAWNRASDSEQNRFVTEVMGLSLDD